jgi:hypothetical protein
MQQQKPCMPIWRSSYRRTALGAALMPRSAFAPPDVQAVAPLWRLLPPGRTDHAVTTQPTARPSGCRLAALPFVLSCEARHARLAAAARSIALPSVRDGTKLAPEVHATDGRQDKSRTVRPGRIAKKSGTINAAPRCAILCRDVRFRKSPARTTILAHRITKALRDRALAHNRGHFAHSPAAIRRG